jgi:fimbrial chaperone protein
MIKNRALQAFAITILGFLTLAAGDGAASAFTVTPVRVFLNQGTSSALLSVRNDSTETIRFQISLQAWNQAPSGEMQLSDTHDLVFFPAMMELKPAEQKNVRVGSTFKAPVTTERSYRIFFEELPPPNVAATATDAKAAAEVRVLTKMGVPIFIQPLGPVVKGEIANAVVNASRVEFDIRNIGNSFFSVSGVTLTGMAKSGTTTFEKKQDGWYVLAGGSRHYQFDIPADQCRGTDHLRVEIASTLADDKGNPITLQQQIALSAASCGAASPSH